LDVLRQGYNPDRPHRSLGHRSSLQSLTGGDLIPDPARLATYCCWPARFGETRPGNRSSDPGVAYIGGEVRSASRRRRSWASSWPAYFGESRLPSRHGDSQWASAGESRSTWCTRIIGGISIKSTGSPMRRRTASGFATRSTSTSAGSTSTRRASWRPTRIP